MCVSRKTAYILTKKVIVRLKSIADYQEDKTEHNLQDQLVKLQSAGTTKHKGRILTTQKVTM